MYLLNKNDIFPIESQQFCYTRFAKYMQALYNTLQNNATFSRQNSLTSVPFSSQQSEESKF